MTTATVAGTTAFLGAPPASAALPDAGAATAYGINVKLAGSNFVGPTPVAVLPPSGASVTAQTLPINVPGLISANSLNASVSSTNYGTAAETINAAAGAEGLQGASNSILGVAALNLLNATAVNSSCTSDAAGSTGQTTEVGLQIGTAAPIVLPAPIQPNTGLTAAQLGPLAGVVTITLNAQTVNNRSVTLDGTNIQVIGLQITLLSGVDGGIVINVAGSNCQATGPDIEAPPSITTVTPDYGPVAGGTPVTIDGSGFVPSSTVSFGTVAATNVVYVSSTQLTAKSPPATLQTANSTVAVSATNTFGSGSTTVTAVDGFTYEVVPSISVDGINPDGGPTTGGTPVTITGLNFGPDSTVAFCVPPADTTCSPATDVKVVNSTTITAVSPASPLAGTGVGPSGVTVKDAGGTSGPTTFTYLLAPVFVSSVVPPFGPALTANAVTINGGGFDGSSTVAFCSPVAAASGPVDTTCVAATGVTDAGASTSQLTAVSPLQVAGVYDVIVTTPGVPPPSPGVVGDEFTDLNPPVVPTGDLNPDFGPTTGGTVVTLTGTNLTGITKVTFDTTTCTKNSVVGGSLGTDLVPGTGANTDTTAMVTTPAGPASPPPATVCITAGGGSAPAADGFNYIPAPTVSPLPPSTNELIPNSGPTSGGTTVTITGTNLGSTFGGPTTVTFGGVQATDVTVATGDASLTAVTPANPAGPVAVQVTDAGGTTTASQQFTYLAPPLADTLSPAFGPTTGGTVVTITGTGLTGISAVNFGGTCTASGSSGGTPGTSLTPGSDTTATVTTPAHAVGAVIVCITATGGTNQALEPFTYESNPPVFTSFTPTQGPTGGGTTVTITGSGFGVGDPLTAVEFGANAGTDVDVVSTTQITVVTPASTLPNGGVGPVAVTLADTVDPTPVTATQQFTYVIGPVVSGISPTSGPEGGGETVTIKGTGLCGATSVLFGTASATIVSNSTDCTTLTVTEPAGTGTVPVYVTTGGGTAQSPENFTYISPGYWEAASDGGVFAFGGARFLGSVPGQLAPGQKLNSPIVAMADTPDHGGYWLFAADGGVFTFGDANFFGSVPQVLKPHQVLNGPVVTAEATPDGLGYRLFAADGGVFDFGDAVYEGSLPGEDIFPTSPVAGATAYPFGEGPNPNNAGYWLVGADGTIYTFGNAPTTLGNGVGRLSSSVVALATTPTGEGYYMFAQNGQVAAFGDALGNLGSASAPSPIVFGQSTSTGQGYWEFSTTGGVYSFGDAPYEGALTIKLNAPITAAIAFGST